MIALWEIIWLTPLWTIGKQKPFSKIKWSVFSSPLQGNTRRKPVHGVTCCQSCSTFPLILAWVESSLEDGCVSKDLTFAVFLGETEQRFVSSWLLLYLYQGGTRPHVVWGLWMNLLAFGPAKWKEFHGRKQPTRSILSSGIFNMSHWLIRLTSVGSSPNASRWASIIFGRRTLLQCVQYRWTCSLMSCGPELLMERSIFWLSYVSAFLIWKNSLTSDGMKLKRLHFSSDKSFCIANFIPQGQMVLRLNVLSLYCQLCTDCHHLFESSQPQIHGSGIKSIVRCMFVSHLFDISALFVSFCWRRNENILRVNQQSKLDWRLTVSCNLNLKMWNTYRKEETYWHWTRHPSDSNIKARCWKKCIFKQHQNQTK